VCTNWVVCLKQRLADVEYNSLTITDWNVCKNTFFFFLIIIIIIIIIILMTKLTSIAPISSKRIKPSGAPSTGVGQTHSLGTMQSSSTRIMP